MYVSGMMALAVVLFLQLLLSVIGHPVDNTETQYVVGGAVVLLNADFKPQLVSDILESTLYPQMMANHAYDRFSQFSQWYEESIIAR